MSEKSDEKKNTKYDSARDVEDKFIYLFIF